MYSLVGFVEFLPNNEEDMEDISLPDVVEADVTSGRGEKTLFVELEVRRV